MYPLNTIADLVVLPASVFRVVSSILNEIEESMERSSLLEDFKMSELPALKAKCIQLVELLVTITIENESVKIDYAVISHCWLLKYNILQFLKLEGNENQSGNVVKVLQDMFELVTYDMMTDGSRLGFLRALVLGINPNFKINLMRHFTPFHFHFEQNIGFDLPFPTEC